MFKFFDYISILQIFSIILLYKKIRGQIIKLGKLKEKIIEATLVIFLFNNIFLILTMYRSIPKINIFNIIIFIIFIIIFNFYYIFFRHNVRNKGLVIYGNILFWKDIIKVRITNSYFRIVFKKDKKEKKVHLDIFNFDSNFLEKELNKRNIVVEFPNRK